MAGITDVTGIRVGHASDFEGITGCTVVLMPPEGAVGGVDVRGAAPGTRETALLRPDCLVERVHAIVFSGGSAFGLDAATGVMAALEEDGVGFQAGPVRVPIVPAAILYDLDVGSSGARPTADMGYAAARGATEATTTEGSVGAGVGATVGKALGIENCMKGGVGSASSRLENVTVGALAVVNALGDVVEPDGRVIAGARLPGGQLANTEKLLSESPPPGAQAGTNTTLVLVATNALLSKTQASRLATVSHNGLARAIRPAHTMYDGDVVFAVSTGDQVLDFNVIQVMAVDAVERAIVRAAKEATSLVAIQSFRDRTS